MYRDAPKWAARITGFNVGHYAQKSFISSEVALARTPILFSSISMISSLRSL